MSEAIAETDEALMEKFFEGEAFTTEEIVQGMAAGVRSGPVSYTHLDVYKRQEMACIERSSGVFLSSASPV